MEKVISSFISDRFPEFVESGHGKFKLFIEAYYEWLEQQNTGEATTVKNLFKELPNAGGLITNADDLRDIDTTFDGFVEYFRREVIPISINPDRVDQRFFIKKVRDLYLAKGSPKSFKLLFRLLFDEDISIFETKENILRSSDGTYLSYPIAIFRVVGNETNLKTIDFTLAPITGNGVDGAVLSAVQINTDKRKFAILKAQLADEYEIVHGKRYIITDPADQNVFVEVEALPILDQLDIKKGGALNVVGDSFYFFSSLFDQKYSGKITSVKTGTVDGVMVRDRGIFYNVGDIIRFVSEDQSWGVGGGLTVTGTDKYGRITEIEGQAIRSGKENNGFLASTLVDTNLVVTDGGVWNRLPTVDYILSESTYGQPYNKTTEGVGLIISPTSTTIGAAGNIYFGFKPYFDSEEDASLFPSAQVAVQNLDPELYEGQLVSFQVFNAHENLEDDSEIFRLTFKIKKPIFARYEETLKLPVGFDSENFVWSAFEFPLDSECGIISKDSDSTTRFREQYIQAIETFQNGRTDITLEVYEDLYINVDSEIIYDGGPEYDRQASAQLTGRNDFIYNANDVKVGSFLEDSYDYNQYATTTIVLTIRKASKFIDSLDSTHFAAVDKLNDGSIQVEAFFERESVPKNYVNTNPGDTGQWNDTGFYGRVQSIRAAEGVITVAPEPGFKFISNDSDLWSIADDKYELFRLGNKTKEGFENVNLPLTNIIAQCSVPEFSYTLAGSAYTSKAFAGEKGVLSSLSIVLQDNYYYSTYTYVISTKTPMSEWKVKVKEMLHPAGTRLLANLNVEQNVLIPDVVTSSSFKGFVKPNKMTFDTSLEHFDPDYKIEGIFADSTVYASNSYEFVDTLNPLGRQVLPSTFAENTQQPYNYQNGDSWWDYEPLGVVADWTSQDSDGHGYVSTSKDTFERYNTKTLLGFYKNTKRYANLNRPIIRQVKFVNILARTYNVLDSEAYLALDSELIRFRISRFDDSDRTYESVSYARMAKELPSDHILKVTPIKRKKELLLKFEKDFNDCLVDPDGHTFKVGDVTYTGFEAWDRKWNVASPFIRTFNTEGWEVVGWSSKFQNHSKYRRRNFEYTKTFREYDGPISNPAKSSMPESVNTVDKDDNWWRWNDTYFDKINTYTEKDVGTLTNEVEYFVRDPKTLMRGRRGR